jgi:hypothetical protein
MIAMSRNPRLTYRNSSHIGALIHLDDEACISALLHCGARHSMRWERPELLPSSSFPH